MDRIATLGWYSPRQPGRSANSDCRPRLCRDSEGSSCRRHRPRSWAAQTGNRRLCSPPAPAPAARQKRQRPRGSARAGTEGVSSSPAYAISIAQRALSFLQGDIRIYDVLQPLLERRLRLEPEFFLRAAHVQAAARLAVRLGGVPADLALEAHVFGDESCELFDGDLHARADIDRLRFVVFYGREHDAFGRVGRVHELAGRRAVSPKLDVVRAGLDGVVRLLNDGRDDV